MFSQAQPIEWVSWAREEQRTYCQGQPYIYNSRVIVVYACVCILNAYVKLSQLNCLKWMKASWTREKNATQTKNHWRKKNHQKLFKNRLENCIFVLCLVMWKVLLAKENWNKNNMKLCELSLLNKVNESDIFGFFSCLTYVSVLRAYVCVFGCVKYDISFIKIAHYNSGPNLILILFREIEKPFEAN